MWRYDGDHMCCGKTFGVGETVTLPLCLSHTGEVTATTEADRVDVKPDGSVVIVGAVAGKVKGSFPEWDGTLIESLGLRFAFWGDVPAPRVRCQGTMFEAHHHTPFGETTGEIAGISWHKAITRRVGDRSFAVVGYEPGIELPGTEDRPGGEPEADDLDEVSGGATPGAFYAAAPAVDADELDDSWAFEFRFRVSARD